MMVRYFVLFYLMYGKRIVRKSMFAELAMSEKVIRL